MTVNWIPLYASKTPRLKSMREMPRDVWASFRSTRRNRVRLSLYPLAIEALGLHEGDRVHLGFDGALIALTKAVDGGRALQYRYSTVDPRKLLCVDVSFVSDRVPQFGCSTPVSKASLNSGVLLLEGIL